MQHDITVSQFFFSLIRSGKLRFLPHRTHPGLRESDRLCLQEYDQIERRYTGREAFCHVDYILFGGQYGIEPGWMMLCVSFQYDHFEITRKGAVYEHSGCKP
ncbi:MAG: DUF3850 domain-containing protein [Kiritimatiellae bacterium]|nr:DUF3850 domain-containing protein [Kiritimatiellia bacterium]